MLTCCLCQVPFIFFTPGLVREQRYCETSSRTQQVGNGSVPRAPLPLSPRMGRLRRVWGGGAGVVLATWRGQISGYAAAAQRGARY